MPTPRPRYLSRITSPISTAPAAHSPPKPSPCKARNTKSCSKFWAKAQRKVKTEYHRIVICSIRTRPNRSASVPENHPPKDEISKVTVPIRPASPRDRPQRDHCRDRSCTFARRMHRAPSRQSRRPSSGVPWRSNRRTRRASRFPPSHCFVPSPTHCRKRRSGSDPSIVSHAKLYKCVGPAMLCGMWASSTALAITAEAKAELERIVRSGRTEQRHALRARIILGAAEGRSNNALAKELKTSRPTVVDWRTRYVEGGVKALFEDRSRGKSFEAVG